MYTALRPLLFLLDAERAHLLAMDAVELLEAALSRSRQAPAPPNDARLRQSLWGVEFPNPIGLAAGFDKDARAPHVWPLLGFGFAELGTVTAQAQPGNERPRVFRYPAERAVINRLGFNNEGAAAVAQRLADLRRRASWSAPIGINIGKSRAVGLDDAIADYLTSFRALHGLADYVVVNVSSPNTPGLRQLQDEERLRALLAELVRENNAGPAPRPILVKVAPDLSDDGLAAIVEVARQTGVSGLVATNTTLDHSSLAAHAPQKGGLSGAPLRARSTAVIRFLYRLTGKDLPIIGVGGVASAEDAYEKIRAGASLVQLYTGMIYAGPGLARSINRRLPELLQRDGYAHLRDAVGTAALDDAA
jgi:dihydroorotate dehydrogenase